MKQFLTKGTKEWQYFIFVDKKHKEKAKNTGIFVLIGAWQSWFSLVLKIKER